MNSRRTSKIKLVALVLFFAIMVVNSVVFAEAQQTLTSCSNYCNTVGTIRAEVNTASPGGCNCVCRNNFEGPQCESCPFRFGGVACDQCAAGRENFPSCTLMTAAPLAGPAATSLCQATAAVPSLSPQCAPVTVSKTFRTCLAVWCECRGQSFDPYTTRCRGLTHPGFTPDSCDGLRCDSIRRECELTILGSSHEIQADLIPLQSGTLGNITCEAQVLYRASFARVECQTAARCYGCSAIADELCGDSPRSSISTTAPGTTSGSGPTTSQTSSTFIVLIVGVGLSLVSWYS